MLVLGVSQLWQLHQACFPTLAAASHQQAWRLLPAARVWPHATGCRIGRHLEVRKVAVMEAVTGIAGATAAAHLPPLEQLLNETAGPGHCRRRWQAASRHSLVPLVAQVTWPLLSAGAPSSQGALASLWVAAEVSVRQCTQRPRRLVRQAATACMGTAAAASMPTLLLIMRHTRRFHLHLRGSSTRRRGCWLCVTRCRRTALSANCPTI
jgi:hypothetical protein